MNRIRSKRRKKRSENAGRRLRIGAREIRREPLEFAGFRRGLCGGDRFVRAQSFPHDRRGLENFLARRGRGSLVRNYGTDSSSVRFLVRSRFRLQQSENVRGSERFQRRERLLIRAVDNFRYVNGQIAPENPRSGARGRESIVEDGFQREMFGKIMLPTVR